MCIMQKKVILLHLPDNVGHNLESGKSYTRAQIITFLKNNTPSLRDGSYQWALGQLLEAGKIVRTGYNSYTLPQEKRLLSYRPDYSELAGRLMGETAEQYPHVQFVVFETVLLNEFLNHMIAQNTIFVQVQKDVSAFVFRTLQEKGHPHLLYKPSQKEFSFYWTRNCIVVCDMISESPLSVKRPHEILIEKMLVDLYCDKLLRSLYSPAEYPDILKQAFATYQSDRLRMFRYARRRNKETEIRQLLDAVS